MCFRCLLTISTWPRIVIKVTFFQCILLRDITVARTFWLSQSEERKNSAKPKKRPSMIRNVSLVNGQTDRLALPYKLRPNTLSSHTQCPLQNRRLRSQMSVPEMHTMTTNLLSQEQHSWASGTFPPTIWRIKTNLYLEPVIWNDGLWDAFEG
jgi:hypothetical protein